MSPFPIRIVSGEDVGLENSNNFEGNVKHRIEIGPQKLISWTRRIIMLVELTLKEPLALQQENIARDST